jgi:DNA polymerase-3 subunit gamma/tau
MNWRLSQVEPVAVAEPDLLVVAPKPGYNATKESLIPDETLEALGTAIQRLIHRHVAVRFQPSPTSDVVPPEERTPEARRADALTSDPLVQKVVELFEARPIQMDYDGPDTGASA